MSDNARYGYAGMAGVCVVVDKDHGFFAVYPDTDEGKAAAEALVTKMNGSHKNAMCPFSWFHTRFTDA